MSNTLAAYFSHSWKTHLPLNLAVWRRLHHSCHLLIDKPVQQTRDSTPPYFISRIESLLRSSDVFVACLPKTDPPSQAAPSGDPGDWGVRCSPYILFEIRLAERADLPRFILYDPKTGFRPPAIPRPHACYVAGRLDEVSLRVEKQDEDATLAELDRWLAWLGQNLRPGLDRDQFRCGLLLGEGAEFAPLRGVVTEAVSRAGFDDPVDLTRGFRHDADLLQTLRSLRLLVVDVAPPSALSLYHLAHALLVPCIRLHSRARAEAGDDLPWVLRGHPAGYQQDLLGCAESEALSAGVCRRAAAVAEDARPIVNLDGGNYELQQRGYVRHLVFLSHNLKGPGRALVDEICRQCRARGIDLWEYEDRNRSGEDWRTNLNDALARMTHFVALLSPTYEQSVECMNEWDRAVDRKNAGGLVLLPFRVQDRSSPMRELRGESHTHQPLPSSQPPEENAAAVVDNVLRHVRRG
jgi:hypothetical protein